jgi:hypothetical protein
MKYKIVLKTSHKHTDRVDNCLETWLSALDYVCLTDKLTGRPNEISCSDKDDYQSNEEKTVNFINLVRTTDQFDAYDWLVFIDDDAILNIPLFEKVITFFSKTAVYGYSMKGSYTKEPELDYPSGGCGYFISPQLIKNCQPMTIKGYGYEDVCMGAWLKENQIKIYDKFLDSNVLHRLYLNGWFPFQRYFNDLWKEGDSYVPKMLADLTEEDVTFLHKHVTHHYIRHKSFMRYLHTLLNEKSPK